MNKTLKQGQKTSNNMKIINDYQYYYEDQVGKGQYSKVFFGKHRPTDQSVAIKVITNNKVDSHIGQELLRNELFALRSLNSEHILKFHQYIYTANNQYLITEYCDQGDLTNCFGISSSDVKCILKQILLGLLELRNKGIIHRDIKPANIMMKNGVVKIVDFGFATQCDNKKLQNLNFGTPLYMAPEYLLMNECTYQSDIWSAGITLYRIIYGQVPFYQQSQSQLRDVISEYTRNPVLNVQKSPFGQILRGMLDPNQNTRWDVYTLLNHPIFCEIQSPLNSTKSEEKEQSPLDQLSPSERKTLSTQQTRKLKSYRSMDGDQFKKTLTKCTSPTRNSKEILCKLIEMIKKDEQLNGEICLKWVLLKLLLEENLEELQYKQALFSYKHLLKGRDLTRLPDPEINDLIANQYKKDNQQFIKYVIRLLKRKQTEILNYKFCEYLNDFVDILYYSCSRK